MSFGTSQSRAVLLALMEALFMAMTLRKDCGQWVETLVDACFVEMTVFSSNGEASEEEIYMVELLEKVQGLLAREQKQIEEAASLCG